MSERHPTQEPRILIVGGGVASLVAGIELRDRLPNAEITLLSAADENHFGGHLASWDEGGYPIEHGLHALFGYYDSILPILKRVGAFENFTQSKRHTFVYENGKIHKFNLSTWFATYTGFTKAEKLKLMAFLPKLAQIIATVRIKGFDALDHYDRYDLREFARRHGMPESILKSGFFRQFYDAAFNEPFELSATVGLESIYKIFARPWHYYFNHPSRQSLVDPLRKYFVESCGGKILLQHKLIRVATDDIHDSVNGLEIQDVKSGETRIWTADEYILGLGLEDFKQVDFGEHAAQNPYFKNIHRLQTVSSMSLQAWFKNDPVPEGIDSLIGGLPEPFSILCPMTCVRPKLGEKSRELCYELIATGPEAGFEDVSDAELQKRFFATLRKCGFRIPRREQDYHVVIRRNREPFHRYLLTKPGELLLRPTYESPYANLSLMGAWVRNSFALPSVDAAAEGGIAVAKLVSSRQQERIAARRNFRGMPRFSPLVMRPPYRFPKSAGVFFLMPVDRAALKSALPHQLEPIAQFSDRVLVGVMRHEQVHGIHDPSGARYDYNEMLVAACVHDRKRSALAGYGLFPLGLYVDDDAAMAAGREVYGFPKKMAQMSYSGTDFSVTRLGRAPDTGVGPALPIELFKGKWTRSAGSVGMAGFPSQLLERVNPLGFFNERDLPSPFSGEAGLSSLQQLTFAQALDVSIAKVSRVQDVRIQVGKSANDQWYRLLGANSEWRAEQGVELEFSFTLGDAELRA